MSNQQKCRCRPRRILIPKEIKSVSTEEILDGRRSNIRKLLPGPFKYSEEGIDYQTIHKISYISYTKPEKVFLKGILTRVKDLKIKDKLMNKCEDDDEDWQKNNKIIENGPRPLY